MSGSVNRVILVGRVGADPELRRFNDGTPVANLRLAVSESWRDKSTGERKEKTEWVNVVVFNENIVKVVEQYVKKGALIYLEGSLQTRSYEKDGDKRYVTEVVLQKFRGELQMLGERRGDGEERQERPKGSGYGAASGGNPSTDALDDEIPF